MKPQELTKYASELAAEAGLSEDETTLLGKVLGTDKVGSKLLTDFVPRSQFSKEMEKLQGQTKHLESELEKQWQWNQQVAPAYQKLEQKVRSIEEANRQYAQKYGDLDNPSPTPSVTPSATPGSDDLEKVLRTVLSERDSQYTDLLRASNDWNVRFPGEMFPESEFTEFVSKARNQAKMSGADQPKLFNLYQDYIRPRVETAQEEARKKREEEIRKEAYEKAKSEISSTPLDEGRPSISHPLLPPDIVKQQKEGTSDEGFAAFIGESQEDWSEAPWNGGNPI